MDEEEYEPDNDEAEARAEVAAADDQNIDAVKYEAPCPPPMMVRPPPPLLLLLFDPRC